MADDRFQDVSDQPDHGRGAIGRVAHGFLSEVRASRDLPRIALAFNAMADPPGPSGYTEFETLPEYWEAAGRDVHRYLAMLAHALRTAPTLDREDLDGGADGATPTRLDGITMVFAAASVATGSGPAGQALAANLAEGFYRRGDIAASAAARRALMAIAVSRTGDGALLSLAPGAIAPTSELAPGLALRGALVDALSELLAALWSHMEAVDRSA